MNAASWSIVGQGLAGTCLAWQLWKRGVTFSMVDREQGGSSRVAAGLINPVTGKNFEPSKGIEVFLPEAIEFYADIERRLGRRIWHPLPVLRLAESSKEWDKILTKTRQTSVARWLADGGAPLQIDGWAGAVRLVGGGRLDTRTFLDESRRYFQKLGFYQKSNAEPEAASENRILCEGSVGLMSGRFGRHRCAKGEILTIRAAGWDPSHIRIGAGGWLVPLGESLFKAGSTYEWNELDELPTAAGRSRVMDILTRLGGDGDFEVLAHEAGIRPILRRSEALIGPLPEGGWMFNGLGSKGSLYAPGMAARLAVWLLDGKEPERELDFRHFDSE